MPQTCENPPAGGADGSGDCSLLGGVNTPDSKPATVKNQASSAGVALRCDFVAAALKRHRERSLLDVKRGSLWAVAAMARYHLDCVLWSLEEPQFDEVFPCAEAFVEHARAVAKLANDLEAERRAIDGQTGAPK